jgi:peroxiredoxin family protein
MVVGLAGGSEERLLVAATVIGGAVALDMEVDVYLLLGGARAFLPNSPVLYDHPETSQALREGMAEAHVAEPLDTLRRLKQDGTVRIHACATAAKLWGADRREQFLDLVDDIVGIAEYVMACQAADVVQVV